MRVIKVTGNNEGLYSPKAYEELRLQLSTGDYHTHQHEELNISDDKYDDVIQLHHLVDNACFVCERIGKGARLTDEFNSPICPDCDLSHALHHEKHPIEGEMRRIRERIIEKLTWKQYNCLNHSDYFGSMLKVSKSRKVLQLVYCLMDLSAQNMAYVTAIEENDAAIKENK